MIRSFDSEGNTTSDWREFNAGIVYLASDVDERIANLESALRTIQKGTLRLLHKQGKVVSFEAYATAMRSLADASPDSAVAPPTVKASEP